MVLFKVLDAKNVNYNPDLLKRLSILYKGGYAVKNNADLFLSQLAAETPISFEDRKKCASYLPFMSDIIDFYASKLFAGEVSVSEGSDADNIDTLGSEADDQDIYKLFLACADLKGNSLEEVVRRVITDALIHSYSFIGIDFPKVDEKPLNLLEEEMKGTSRPYLYYIDSECVIDWSFDDAGKLNWVKIKSDCVVQNNPLEAPMHQIEFKIWTKGDSAGETNAKWEIYQTVLLKIGKLPAPNDDISLFDADITSFKEIPVLRVCIPDGLALGVKIGPICEDIFQRTTILVNGENKSLNAIRIVYLGDESNAPGGPTTSMVQENPFRAISVVTDWESRGFGVLGGNDKMEVVESKGHAFTIVADQIDKLIEKLKEVVHQMANATPNTKNAKSAQSKVEDRHATEMILTAYGSVTRDFIQQIMSCISSGRGETIVWSVGGLDNFSTIDRDQLILEAAAFPNVTAGSMSPTFTKLYTEKFYLSLLDGTSQEDALIIRDEIFTNVETSFILPADKEKQDNQNTLDQMKLKSTLGNQSK
jgi:hypothetical protein